MGKIKKERKRLHEQIKEQQHVQGSSKTGKERRRAEEDTVAKKIKKTKFK